MKAIVLIALLAGAAFMSTGCATPAYSARERNRQIARNQAFESRQIVDDFDHLLLLRPAGRLTIWNVQ